MKRFQDTAVLITGAGGGIGAACVQRLFAEGASIAAADVRKEEVDRVVSQVGLYQHRSVIPAKTAASH